jgi:hypothetical protein
MLDEVIVQGAHKTETSTQPNIPEDIELDIDSVAKPSLLGEKKRHQMQQRPYLRAN